MLNQVSRMLTEPIDVNVFHAGWTSIIYLISLFYGIFFLFAGLNLMISGYDAAKREAAKEWLRNTVLMILFVNASFLIYGLLIELASILSAGFLGMVDPNFFLPLAQNVNDLNIHFFMMFAYSLSLLLAVLLLGVRYIVVAAGVILFPIAIFLYFIPPLRSVGSLIMNVVFAAIFITVIDGIFLFIASIIATVPALEPIRLTLTASGFLIIDAVMILMVSFALFKAVFSVKRAAVGGALIAGVRYLKGRQSGTVSEDRAQTKLSSY